MKHFNFKTLAMAALLTGGVAFSASADYQVDPNSLYGRQLLKQHSVREYQGNKPIVLEDPRFEGSDMQKDLASKRMITPDYTYDKINGYSYMNGPNGNTWFYTSTVRSEWTPYPDNPPEYAEWFGEVSIVSFTFTIYNEMFERVGHIADKITLEPNEKWTEKRCRDVWLDPAVSQHFFNDDDNYEVMVFHAINTEIKNYLPGNWSYAFVNRYYQKVYSIGGETDNEGNNICINQIEGRCVDATNVAIGSGDEEFYYTFIQDGTPDFTKFVVSPNDEDYVDHVKSLISPLTTYRKAADGEGIEEIFRYDLYNTKVPGDTTEGIYLITKTKDGKGYFVYSQYEKPYLVNPLGGALDESATPDNNLVITAYELSGGKMTEISETKIPVEDPSTEEKLIYAFYSIGSLTYRDDVDISGALGTVTAPAYIVTHQQAAAATLEDLLSSAYEVYDNQGNHKHNIAVTTAGVSVIGVTEDGPLAMVVDVDELERIYFHIHSLYKNKTIATFSQENGMDPLLASMALSTSYDEPKYAFVMMYWDPTDAARNDHARVQWFNADGSKDRIDHINLGQDVEAAQVFMISTTMNPYLFDDDDQMEYAVLVSRKYGDSNREEFLIVDDSGKWYGMFSEDDHGSSPKLFDIIPGDAKTPNRLMLAYENGTVDIYNLPFSQDEAFEPSGVEEIIADGEVAANISFDGGIVYSAGNRIELYRADGAKVGQGRDFLNVSGFESGVYVVVATDADGNGSSVKILK